MNQALFDVELFTGIQLHMCRECRVSHTIAKKLGAKICMEIGVQEGTNARDLYECVQPEQLVLVDPWVDIDRSSISEVYYADNYSKAINWFLGNANVVFVREYSQIALPRMQSSSFDYVYLDGDHLFGAVVLDILNSIRILKVGGLLAGHDHGGLAGIVRRIASWVAVPDAVAFVLDGSDIGTYNGDWWILVTEDIKRLEWKC